MYRQYQQSCVLKLLLEAGAAQSLPARHRLLLGARRPRLRDERHRVEVAVHALGEADLARSGGGGLRWWAVVARCRASPAEDAGVREEASVYGWRW